MAVSHRDDVAVRAPPGPYDHNHPFIKEARADPTNLAIVEPVIDNGHRLAGKTFSVSAANRDPGAPVSSRVWPDRMSSPYRLFVAASDAAGKDYVTT
jgi:hypothetical protein